MAPHHNEDLLLGHASVPREGLLAGEDHLAPEADPDRPCRPTEVLLAPPESALLPRLFRHLAGTPPGSAQQPAEASRGAPIPAMPTTGGC